MQKNDRSGDDSQRDSVSEHQLCLFAFLALFIFPIIISLYLDSLHLPSKSGKSILVSSFTLYTIIRVTV